MQGPSFFKKRWLPKAVTGVFARYRQFAIAMNNQAILPFSLVHGVYAQAIF